MKPHQIVLVVYPEITVLDLAGPLQVFSDAARNGADAFPYKIDIVSLTGGTIESDTPLPVRTTPMKNFFRRTIDTLIVIGGGGVYDAYQDEELVSGVSKLIKRSRRICSVCSGAYVLAATGVLDNHRVATHWWDCENLAKNFPKLQVDIEPIYIREGNVWTSAGVTAGIDMALALLAEDHGRAVALNVARSLVAYMVRPGGQSQFSAVIDRQMKDTSGRFDALHDWIAENLDRDLSVDALAGRMSMSPRNFSRVYSGRTGMTPAKAVEAIRLEAAARLLETTARSISEIAIQCGFVDDERMRRAFLRAMSVSPSDYRKRFQFETQSA